MPRLPEQRGRIIAERIFQRWREDGTFYTVRVELEEPAQFTEYLGETAETQDMPWHCVVCFQEGTWTKRVAMDSDDAVAALFSALRTALHYIDILPIGYGSSVTFAGQKDLLLGVWVFPRERPLWSQEPQADDYHTSQNVQGEDLSQTCEDESAEGVVMSITPEQRGRIIAERVLQRRREDGTLDTIRVGLEEPAQYTEYFGETAETAEMPWHCVTYIDEGDWIKRVAMVGFDSLEAVFSALSTVIVYIEGIEIRYGSAVTYSGEEDIQLGVWAYPLTKPADINAAP